MPRGNPRLRTDDGRQNIVGPQVRSRSKELKITQDELCARIARVTEGEWNPAAGDIYRIVTQARIVSDVELVALAKALEMPLVSLFGSTVEATRGQ